MRLATYCIFAACLTFAAAASADDSYVRRPQGWFVLVPPLTASDPVTGAQSVDDSAPQKRWSAMIIRGRDGHNYDFYDEDTCKMWINLLGMRLYQMPGGTANALWLAKSKCTKDDNRHSVITNDHWSKLMQQRSQ